MSPSDTSKRLRYEGVQALRAVAVLLVMLTHLKYAGDFSRVSWIRNHAGAGGVDIFFVISGFVICASAESLNFGAGRFFENRFTRIAPLYWLTTLPLLLSMLKKGAVPSVGSWVNSFLFLPVLDFGGMSRVINPMGWSLSFEFWFYVQFSLALVAARQHAWRVVLGALVAESLLIGLFYRGSYFFPTFISTPLTLEFGAGILIYRFRNRISSNVAALALAGALVLCVVSWIAGAAEPPFGDTIGNYFAGLRRAATWGLLGVCLVILVVYRDRRPGMRWPKPLLRMGDYSFSLYMFQPYGLWIATKLMDKTRLPAWVTGLSFVVSTLVLGSLLSIFLEGRLTRWARAVIDAVTGRRPRRSAAIVDQRDATAATTAPATEPSN